MKKIFYIFLLIGIATSCQKKTNYWVHGNVSEATDSVLYLEQMSLADGVVQVDSVRLDEKGNFSFAGLTPSYPEFYRLRISNQCINLGVECGDTIVVEACMKDFSLGYRVEGSGACDTIQILSKKLAELDKGIKEVANDNGLTIAAREKEIDFLMDSYKEEIKTAYLHRHLSSPSSYFACFQTLGGLYLFNPLHNKNDLAWIRAVANAWNELYPESPRTKNLANIVLQAKKNQTTTKEITLDLSNTKVRELGIIDVELPDINGKINVLSDLRGKVVLLDFISFALEGSHERTLKLRELYDKYHSRGFEIYQVGLDQDRNFWAQRCESLPWISVFCEQGFDSKYVNLYQVSTLPYFFLIDKNCDLQARMEYINDLDQAIESLLNK